jgi:hypothetical protein
MGKTSTAGVMCSGTSVSEIGLIVGSGVEVFVGIGSITEVTGIGVSTTEHETKHIENVIMNIFFIFSRFQVLSQLTNTCAEGDFYPKHSWQDITIEKSRCVAHGAAIPLHAGLG